MDLTNPRDIRALLLKSKLYARKQLGQHFLISRRVLQVVIRAAELKSSDAVLEIGSGIGALTQALVAAAGKVIAVEKDPAMIEILETQLADADNLRVFQGDIRYWDISLLPHPYKLVANIPYYLTGILFRKFLEQEANKPALMVLMIQREVAERVVAKPPHMSVLSASVQLFADAKIVLQVPRKNFYPAPAVDSAVVKLTLLRHPRFPVHARKFLSLVQAGFSSKRKMLANALSHAQKLPKDKVTALLVKSRIPITARAQELSLADWYRLYKRLADSV
jgi:16S rRNA (adenine1518-N6/adenine1519-N6)-dimethyltransferase